MGKKKKNKKNTNYFLLAILIVLVGVYFLLSKLPPFQQSGNLMRSQTTDITQLPKDIEQSIKNLKPQKYAKMPILLYHYVEYVKDDKDTIRKSLNIIPYIFDAQVKTLKDAGYTFITPADLSDFLDDKKELPIKSVILSFDDGYRDFYTDVFPILKKYQVKAVAYIVPNFLNKPNNMDLWQLQELAQSGLVEIGAHTMDHSYLSGLSGDLVKYEVEESKKYLEENLGIKIISFAYPYGAFDNQTIDVVKKAGFTTAVTTINGIFAQDINRFFLYRIRPGARIGQSLLDLLDKPSIAQY